MSLNFDDLIITPVYAVGDVVEVHDGRRGCIERIVMIQTEADRRAGKQGRRFYEIDFGYGPERFKAIQLKKIDILDALADS